MQLAGDYSFCGLCLLHRDCSF